MTENNASVRLEVIRAGLLSGTDAKIVSSEENIKTTTVIINELEEIQQYRKHGITIKSALNNMRDLTAAENLLGEYSVIGTPEECRKSVEICKSMIERNITPEDMEEYMKFEDECISEEFTLKSLLEAREKQKAKKPDYEGDGYSDGHLVYDTWICPCCGKHYEIDYDDYDFCPACGQCIDWSDEE